ncbi:MAG: relaxase domain-containing protein [Gammaproteobacteria bacterium]|nr:relaxase domain-containing protein [Gammaproteobacteria bacterium]
MMTLKSLSGGPGAARNVVSYCQHELGDSRRGDGYYSKGATPSMWGGTLAAELGLAGPVDGKVLQGLLEGRLPDGRTFGTDGVEKDGHRRMGVDMTFSAPKSVSEFALCKASPEMRERILAAHDRAVAKAMALAEREFVCARYGSGGAESVKTGAMLWSAFRHEDARPVNGKVAPQIHSHAVTLNMTKGRDGEIRALNLQFGNDGIKLAGATYRAELGAELRALGFGLRKTGEGYELEGVSDAQIEAGSPRRQQIDSDLESKGLSRENSTGAQRTASNLATRESKRQMSQDEQRWAWRELGREIGLDMFDPTPPQEPLPEPGASEALAFATDHLSERESVISSQSVRLQALLHGMHQGLTLDQIDKEIESARGVGNLIDAGDQKIVTRQTLACEASNLAAVSAGRGALTPLTDEAGAEARIAAREAIERTARPDFVFSRSQREAVIKVLTTSDKFIVIRGAAGAGKSTALAALADEAKSQGFRVVGTGPSQTAVDGTKDVNPDDARTLASFCMREEKDDTPRLILMDEAGMVSARDMQAFLEKVRPQDKVVFVGDDLQLAAVEAGSPMAQFMKEKVVEVVEIDEIVRQKDAGLLAVATAFADGRNEEAVQLAAPYMAAVTVTDADYESAEASKSDAKPVNGPLPDATRSMLNLVKTIRKKHKDIPAPSAHDFKTVREWLDTHSKVELGFEAKVLAPQAVRMQAIARETAQAYIELSQTERDKTLVLAATNEMRRAINEKVKAGLQEQIPEGADVPSVTVTALDKSQCTRAQLREAIHYKEGMILRVPEGRGRARKIVDWTITATDPTRNTVTARNREGEEKTFKPRDLNPKECGIYTPRKLDLAIGDRVVFTENNRGSGFQNNETGTVTVAGDGKVEVRKDDGNVVTLDADKTHTLDHGWAVTVHRSQGRTVDRAMVAGMSSKRATANLAYVACSRERWFLQIFTDNIKALQQSWAKVAERETAKDATEKAAKARETAPLETARESVRAEVQARIEKAVQEQEAIEREPETKPEPPVRERERELGDSYGW